MSGPVERRERWEPDDQLISAVLRITDAPRMSDLNDPDRCWVVAGLTLASMTAEDIADRLKCSLRLVRSVRAADMTQVCMILQRESQAFTNQMALAESEARATARDLAASDAENRRLRAQLDRVIDAGLVGQPIKACGQGHLLTDWNTYWRNGRWWCRECHAERQRDYRLARKLNLPAKAVTEARRAGLLDELRESVLALCSTDPADDTGVPSV